MSDISSRDKWRNKANFDKATTDAAKAQQQNITIEELAKRDEATRLAKLPDPVKPENQEAISQSVAQVAEEERAGAAQWQREQDHIAIYGSAEEQNPEKTYDWKEEWQKMEENDTPEFESDSSSTEISRMDQVLEMNRDSFKEDFNNESVEPDKYHQSFNLINKVPVTKDQIDALRGEIEKSNQNAWEKGREFTELHDQYEQENPDLSFEKLLNQHPDLNEAYDSSESQWSEVQDLYYEAEGYEDRLSAYKEDFKADWDKASNIDRSEPKGIEPDM